MVAVWPLKLWVVWVGLKAAWIAATAIKGMTATKLATTMFMSGLYLYTYNEFAFKVSAPLGPVAERARDAENPPWSDGSFR